MHMITWIFLICIINYLFPATSEALDQDINKEESTEKKKVSVPTYRACTFDGEYYGHNEKVDVGEPCLRCTCVQGLLSCYRTPCLAVHITPDKDSNCTLKKKPGKCCPVLECYDVQNTEGHRNETAQNVSTKESKIDDIVESDESGIEESLLDILANSTDIDDDENLTTNLTEPVERQSLNKTVEFTFNNNNATANNSRSIEDRNMTRESRNRDIFDSVVIDSNLIVVDDDVEKYLPEKLPKNFCFYGGSIYSEGSAIEPGDMCENCFCLNGKKQCVRKKCILNVQGCTPHYDLSDSCCPSSYNCSVITPWTTPTTTETALGSEKLDPSIKCWIEDKSYSIGDRVFKTDHCDICYCMNSGIECETMTCDTEEKHDCTPKYKHGECCPVQYNCASAPNFHEDKDTHIHISDSEVNDTMLAILLEHVFGSDSLVNGTTEKVNSDLDANTPFRIKEPIHIDPSEDSEFYEVNNKDNENEPDNYKPKIKPIFLEDFLIKDLKPRPNHSKPQAESLRVEAETNNDKSENSTPSPLEDRIGLVEESGQYQPLFIDAHSIENYNHIDAPHESQIQQLIAKPVRENDRLIDLLNMDHVLQQQFNLRKIPPLVLQKEDLSSSYPVFRKEVPDGLQKKKPGSKFGPPPTLPPRLVASILSMFRSSPSHVNNRINRGKNGPNLQSQSLGYQGAMKSLPPLKRSRKEDFDEPTVKKTIKKPNIKFIPFLAADAVGGGDVKQSGWGDDTVDIVTTLAPDYICVVGDKNYTNYEEVPKEDPCSKCHCLYGQVLCKKEKCSPTPPGCQSVQMKGDCCPVHSCGDGLIQIVNPNNYDKNRNETTPEIPQNNNPQTAIPQANKTNNFDSVFRPVTVGNIFKSSKQTTASQPPNTTYRPSTTTLASSTKRRKTTTTRPKSITTILTSKPQVTKDEHPDDLSPGTYVGTFDVVPISRQPPKKSRPGSQNDDKFNVGSVLSFGVDEDQEIIEDGGILTSATKPDFDPYDILSDLFVPEEKEVTIKKNTNKEWSSEMDKPPHRESVDSLPTKRPVVSEKVTKRPTVENVSIKRTTIRRVKVTTRPPTTTTRITRRTTSRTTTQRRPTTTRRPRTTSSPTTTIKIDITDNKNAGHFNDPWGLLKVSGCNIKGQTYMLNADIPELSNSCRKCTCSSMGVMCQNLGC